MAFLPRPSGLLVVRFPAVVIFLFALLVAGARAQIAIVAGSAGTNQVALGETYVQNFNALPSSGSVAWSN